MANRLVNIIELDVTTSGVGLTEDFTFSGGTTLNKMFSIATMTGVWDPTIAVTNLQVPKGTVLIANDTLRVYNGVTPNQIATFKVYIFCYTPESDLVVHRVAWGAVAPSVTTVVAIPAISSMAQTFWTPHGFTRAVANAPATTYGFGATIRLGGALGVDPTILDVFFRSNGCNACYCELVDWNNADIKVQHLFRRSSSPAVGTLTYDYVDGTIAFIPVDPARTFLLGWSSPFSGGGSPATPQPQNYNPQMAFTGGGTGLRISFNQHTCLWTWVTQVIEDVSAGNTVFRVSRPADIAMGAAELEGESVVSPGVSFAVWPMGSAISGAGWCGTSNDAASGAVDNSQGHMQSFGQVARLTRGNARGATLTLANVQLVDFFTFDGNEAPESSIAPCFQVPFHRELGYQGGGRRR